MADYWKKKLDELNKSNAKSSSTKSSSTKSSSSYWQNKMNGLEESNKKKDDIAPVRTTSTKKKDERKWFQKGAFEDGYDFGDVTKTILGTVTDVAEDVGTGIIGMGEKVVDALAWAAPYIAQGQYYQNGGAYQPIAQQKVFEESITASKKGMADFIKKDLYDEEKVAKTIISAPVKSLTGVDIEEASVLGEKSDSLAQSGGQLLGTIGLQAVGVPWFLTTGATSFGSEAESALNEGATMEEAGASAAISAGAEILTEKISGGIRFGGKTLDDVLLKPFVRGISNKTVRLLANAGIDAVGEGGEEILSGVMSAIGQKLTYMDDKELSELFTKEEAVESFIGGFVLGGVGNVAQTIKANKKGIDAVTGLTTNEQKVVDKVYEDRIAEEEKNGKLTQKRKAEIYDQVLEDMDKGYITTDAIESVLGGDTYKTYKDTIDSEDALTSEYEALGRKQNATLAEQSRYAELKQQIEELKTTSQRDSLKTQLSDEVFGMVQNDRLLESYNERGRKSQSFNADLTQYDAKQQETVKKAIESGILNNTNRTHEFVDTIAKISADKGVLFDFTNNAKLKDSGFAVDGKSVNGYVTKDSITLNIDSPKAWQSTVGHEITHVLEGTEMYDALKQTVFEYAKSKGEYDSRLADLTETYKSVKDADIDAELTADLVGDYLFSDSDFIKNLSAQHRNVFQKIYDEIKYLCKIATAGSKEARELERVKRAFEEAYRAEKNTANDSGTKYMLTGVNSQGIEVYETSQEVMDMSIAERKKEYLRLMTNEYAGRTARFVRNGHTYYAEFDKKDLSKPMYGDDRSSKSGKKALVRAGADGDIFDLVENAEYTHSKVDTKDHKNADYFDYYVKTVQIDGKVYDLLADVKKQYNNGTQGYAYTLILKDNKKIKAHPATANTNVAVQDAGQALITGNNVAQDGEDVKYSLTDSNGKELTKEQQEYFKNSTPFPFRSLSNEGEQVAPVGTPLRDLRLEQEAPVAATEDIAPTEAMLEQLEAERDSLMDKAKAALDNGDADSFARLSEDWHTVDTKFKALDGEIAQDLSDRLASITDEDAPPEAEAPYYEGGKTTVDDPFYNRDIYEVGNRKVKAYMYENPEVKPFFQPAAEAMRSELLHSLKGERWYSGVDYLNDSGYVSHGMWGGTKRQTSDDIAYLLDEHHYTYKQIEKGLDAIIEDDGAENNAVSKRIEFLLNDRLINGYTDFQSGYKIPPDQDYINLLNEKQITEYNKEAFDRLMEQADEYMPPISEEMDDIAPVAEKAVDIAPVKAEAVAEEKEAKPVEEKTEKSKSPRQTLHNGIMDNIKSVFKEKGFDFDNVLKKAKNLSTFSTVDNTPQRVMEKALGYKEGQILSDITVNNVAQNETEGIKWLNSFTDRKNGLLAQISKQYNIKPGSKESAAAQMYAEGFYVDENNDIIEYGDAELAKDFPNAKVQANIKGLAGDARIRRIYDDTLAMINESRTRNAYPEIPRLDNYFLHFRAMEDTFSKLGLPFNPNDIRAKDLPTDLNGVTADLKPGQPYFASAMHRTGKRTSFDLLGGLEKYLSSAKNQIYHIDDIQTLRALRNYIADTYGQAKGLENLDELSQEAQWEQIQKVYDSHLSTFAKFLNDEANIIAGKTSLMDRGVEGKFGRRGITFLDSLNKQAGSNMVGFNISSSLTNFLPVAQTFAKTNKADFVKAFAQTASNKVGSIFGRNDGFAERSPVMIRRKGADRFYRTPWQKASDVGYTLMSAVDNISTELIARTKYNELTRKGMDSQKAHYETDKWVSRLMGDRSLGQMPQLFDSKTLGLLTKFQLEVRNQLDSQFYDTIQEAKVSNEEIENRLARNAKTAAKVTSTFVQLAVVQHLFGKAFESVAGYNPAFDIIEVLLTACGFDDDEDSEDTTLDNIEQGFLALLDDLPYTSTLTGGRIPISSVLPIEELVKGVDEWGNEKSRWKTLGEIAPYLLPGGYGQIKKTVQGLKMFDDDLPIAGSYTDSGNLRFPVEDTLGNRIQAGIFGQWASENARDYFDNERSPLKEKQIQEFIDVGIPIRDYWEYREGLSGLDNLSEKADYINSLDLPVEKKNLLINNIADRKEDIDMEEYDDYSSFEEFDFAIKNPEKYEIAEKVGGYEAYMGYKEDMKEMKLAEKAEYIANLNLTVEQKNALINGETDRKEPIDMTGYDTSTYSSFEEFEWAKEYPEKYTIARAVGGYEAYQGYSDELNDIHADKDKYGKSISGSRKEKVLEYINSMDADYYTKIILWKNEYNSDDSYNEEIIEYINGRDDFTFKDRIAFLREIGFDVDDEGNISW